MPCQSAIVHGALSVGNKGNMWQTLPVGNVTGQVIFAAQMKWHEIAVYLKLRQ